MKKIVAVFAAATMLLALPTLAFAAPSPNVVSGNSGNVSASAPAGSGIEKIEAASAQASNVKLESGEKVVASFEVTGSIESGKTATISFNVGKEYANHAFKVFIQHATGDPEVQKGVVAADGSISVTVDRLSTFSIAVGDQVVTSGNGNTGSTSPKTGIDATTTAAGAVACLVAAGVVVVALRKKVTE